jgi:hypothetical protein
MTVPSSKGAAMLVRRCVLVMGLAGLLLLPLAGCANPASMPRLHAHLTVGPQAHQAVLRITASGKRWSAYSGIVLSYPDGRRRMFGAFAYGAGDVGYWELDGLPSGDYNYTVYAVPLERTDELFQHGVDRGYKPFPVGEMVKKNVTASGTFVIP